MNVHVHVSYYYDTGKQMMKKVAWDTGLNEQIIL